MIYFRAFLLSTVVRLYRGKRWKTGNDNSEVGTFDSQTAFVMKKHLFRRHETATGNQFNAENGYRKVHECICSIVLY